jgi:glycosyltransferase involved in cell wall biosynthesis
MRILRVITSANPVYGGPIEALKQTTKALSALGHVTEVVTLDDPKMPWVTGQNLSIHALGPCTRLYSVCPRLIPWLKRNGEKYDVIIQHGLWNYTSVATWTALRRLSKPYFVYTHGMLDPWFRESYPIKHLAKQIVWWLADGRLLRDARAVLFTTEEERLLARDAFWPYHLREIVVGYGTADVAGEPAEQIEAFRSLVPELRGRRYLLFLSRIHPKKGCDQLIRAFAPLALLNPDLDLVVAGPDQVGSRVELERIARQEGIAQRVHWPGMLQNEVKWGAFRACDAFVLPSHQENFGIVVAEALACGKPVLITNKVNIWREVKAAEAGLVAEDNELGISELLRSFFDMPPQQIAEMGRRARQLFLDRFEIKKVAANLLATLGPAASPARASHTH